jgi:hypothetical protein
LPAIRGGGDRAGMRIKNPRVDAVGSAVVLALCVSLLVHAPFSYLYRNPPYHSYGGFDVGYWLQGLLIYGIQLVVAVLLRRSRYGTRPILSVAVIVLIVCLVANLGTFFVALRRPPV